MDDRWAAKLEELREGAVSQGVEWLHGALSEISKDGIRALAVAGGVQGRSGKNWRPLAELREGLEKVLAPAREVGCVKNVLLLRFVFLLEVVCSSLGAVL